MVCSKSAVQLARPLRYLSTSAAGAVAVAAVAAEPVNASSRANAASRCVVMLYSFLGWCGTIDLAAAVGLQRTHQACRLHGLDQARRPVVADLETALDTGDGRLARLGDDAHRLVVQGIGLGIGGGCLTVLVVRWESRNRVARTVQNLVDVGRRRGGLETSDHPMHFLIGDEGAVHAGRDGGAGRQVQHVAVPEQGFRTALIEDRARVYFG